MTRGRKRALAALAACAVLAACAAQPSQPVVLAGAPLGRGVRAVAPDRLAGPVDWLHGLPSRAEDGAYQVVVEIPAGTLAKFEVDKADGTMIWTREHDRPRSVAFLPYPGNYGMVPRTLSPRDQGGDGDPIDALVLAAAVPRGQVVRVRWIGVLRLVDRGEIDDKLIAVPTDANASPFSDVRDIDDLERRFPGARDILATWFASYKGPGQAVVERWGNAAEAAALADAAERAYQATRALPGPSP